MNKINNTMRNLYHTPYQPWLILESRVDRGCNTDFAMYYSCLLYTSDAADDMQCVDLGGRRIIKKDVLLAGTCS